MIPCALSKGGAESLIIANTMFHTRSDCSAKLYNRLPPTFVSAPSSPFFSKNVHVLNIRIVGGFQSKRPVVFVLATTAEVSENG